MTCTNNPIRSVDQLRQSIRDKVRQLTLIDLPTMEIVGMMQEYHRKGG